MFMKKTIYLLFGFFGSFFMKKAIYLLFVFLGLFMKKTIYLLFDFFLGLFVPISSRFHPDFVKTNILDWVKPTFWIW